MKKLTFLILFLSFASFGISQNTQNLQGANTNFYEHLYGTTFNTSSRGVMDALVYIDHTIDNDYVREALIAGGYSYTLATGWTDFDTKLASGGYGLAVAFVQNDSTHPSLAGLQNFINTGGKVIFDDFTLDAAYASLFEASYTGQTNFTSMTITDPTLLTGVSNPVEIHNPVPSGWFTYSMGMVPAGAGEVLATFAPNAKDNGPEPAAIIKGNGGNTIILGYMSDTPFNISPTRDNINNRQKLFQNVFGSLNQPPVPVSPWALVFGIFLIAVFMVIRYKRNLV